MSVLQECNVCTSVGFLVGLSVEGSPSQTEDSLCGSCWADLGTIWRHLPDIYADYRAAMIATFHTPGADNSEFDQWRAMRELVVSRLSPEALAELTSAY